ncbi:MAG: WcaI family glycosyltransferase [Desulfitobacteriaceae bacterium]
MRILIYGINYAPELTGIGKYTSEMAEWMAARGYEVRVVTAPPYYPAWKVGEGYSAWRYRRENLNGVAVWRCPIWVPARPSGIKRILHIASFALSSFPVILRRAFWRPDVVMAIEPPLMLFPTTLVVGMLSGAPVWLHIQDFEVDAAFQLGLLPRTKWLQRLAEVLESLLMRGAKRVSTISPQMVSRLITKKISQAKTVLFPNWVDTKQICPLERPSILREELGFRKDDVLILYAGNMGAKQGLELLLDAAEKLQGEKGIKFILCGDGVARSHLQAEAERRNLSNVMFLPLQPVERLNELLNLADIHALIQKEIASDLVMPSKLTGMLASGRPVVATALQGTAVADVVLGAGAGKLVAPDDIDRLVEALQELAVDKSERDQLGQRARRYAETVLDKECILSDFEKYFRVY